MAEYQNIPLLPGEQVVFAADFTPSPLSRANKVGLAVTRQRVATIHPQHMFLFFKVGHSVSSSPIGAISQVTVGRLLSQHHVRRALVAGVFGLIVLVYGATGFGGLGAISMLLALCLLAIAGLELWLARRLGLSIRNYGGGVLSVGVDQTEYQAMVSAADAIQQLVTNAPPGAAAPPSMNPASAPNSGFPSPVQTPPPYRY